MKRVLCPKCENYLYFDETKYSQGQSLVFICEHCGKQFSIRIGNSKLKAIRKEEDADGSGEPGEYGSIIVVENVFGYKQILNLTEGNNIIGRRCVGTVINTPVETGDMSMDRLHCIIDVKRDKTGNLTHILRDASSITGTFYQNDLLSDKEQIRLNDGDIITIGATTLIVRINQ